MKKKMFLLSLCASFWLFAAALTPAFAGEGALQESVAGSAASTRPAAKSEVSNRGSGVVFKDGRLSVDFHKLALAQLGDELSQKAGIAVIVSDDAAGELVSASFQNVPLDEGLRRILTKQDAFLFYGVDEDKASALKAVWIYSKGRGRGLFPVPPAKWASTKDLYGSLADKDPTVRGQAIETLIARKRQGAQDQLLTAVRDSSDQVRSRALYAGMKSGVELPQAVLGDLALHDSSVYVRFLALQALADSPEARSVAEAALKDPNEAVRSAAQTIIAKLNGRASESQQPSQSLNEPQAENQSPAKDQ